VTTPGAAATHWAEVRRSLKLSRAAFAELTGLTTTAVWRIETKGVFKSGELDRLREAFLETPTESVETSAQPPTPAPPLVDSPDPGNPVEDALATLVAEVPDVTDVTWHGPDPTKTAVTQVVDAAAQLAVAEVDDSAMMILAPDVASVALPRLSPLQLTELDGVYRFSNSEIRTFKECRRRWWLTYYRRLVPRSGSPVGVAATGDRIHRALRLHYHPDPAVRVDVREALERVISFDRKTLDKRHAQEPVPEPVLTRLAKDVDLERIMVEGYVEWLAETGEDEDLQVVGTEEYVEVDMDVLGVKLVGKLDARVRRVSDNLRLFIDHKTLADFTAATFALPSDEQMLFYLLLESLREDEDQRCVGALYNMLRRVKRTGSATPPFYLRVEVHHSNVTLNAFRRRTLGTITEILRVRDALDAGADFQAVAYPTPTRDCRWRCPHAETCVMHDDGSRVEGALEAYFEVGDPTSHYSKE